MQIYVLDQSADRKTINLVFHFAVPSANNSAGVNWQTALVNFLGGSANIKSILPEPPDDLSAMQAGSVFEHAYSHRWSTLGLTAAEMLAEIQAAYTAQESVVLSDLQARLTYYGYTQ